MCITDIKNTVLSAKYVATGEEVNLEQKGNRLFLKGLQAPLKDPRVTKYRGINSLNVLKGKFKKVKQD